jgi:HEAT repeat protein
VRVVVTTALSQSSRFRTIAALLIFVLSGLLWFLTRQLHPEPAYRGKPLTLWLRTYAPSSPSGRGSPAWSEADDAVRHIGTNSIPILLKMLRASDSKLKLRLVELVQKQRLIKLHFVPATVLNIEASRAFVALGDTAKDAVPGLMKIYDERISIESQRTVEEALGWIGPEAKPAIPLLLSAATNSNSKVRASALWTLGEIHAEPSLCVPELIGALADSDDWAQLSAAHALGLFGADAQSAVLALKELASSPIAHGKFSANRIQVRVEARNALQKINPGAASLSDETIPGFEIPAGVPVFPSR